MPASIAVATLLSLAAALATAWITRPADDWMDALCSRLKSWVAGIVIALACFATLFNDVRSGVVLLAGAALIVRYLHRWMNRRRGGITLAGFMATALSVEFFALLILGVLK